MLLGRTANGLYWMNRYIERAENMARLLDAGLRMALTRSENADEEWTSVVVSAGAEEAFQAQAFGVHGGHRLRLPAARHRQPVERHVVDRDGAQQCAHGAHRADARDLGKHQRSLDGAEAHAGGPIDERDLPKVLDAIKRETALIRGTFYGTMLRNEIFDFSQLGTFVERADNTARILDVKYYVLLPSISWVGSSLDNYQWESILRSVSAHRSYRWVYEADYRPTNIADYLILNGRMPRSLAFCYRTSRKACTSSARPTARATLATRPSTRRWPS